MKIDTDEAPSKISSKKQEGPQRPSKALKDSQLTNPVYLNGRIPSLDGWRALAIILVLGSHMPYSSNFPPEYNWITNVFDGNLGVRIFFVLSGFLISLLLLREAESKGFIDLRKFYIRRALRILPVCLVYLSVLGILTVLGAYRDSLSSWLGALTFTRNMIGIGKSATVHFWSLAIEEQFYLAWPLIISIFLLWRRKSLYIAILLLPVAACPVIRAVFADNPPGGSLLNRLVGERSILMYADSLAIGCLAAIYAAKSAWTLKWKPVYNLYLLIAIGTIISVRVIETTSPLKSNLWNPIAPSIQAWAIIVSLWISIHPKSFTFKILNQKYITWIGRLSFSLYVWHMIFLSHFVGDFFNDWSTHHWAIWLIPSFIISTLSYYLLETPLASLRKRLH